jgi:hypothetical protein
MQRIQKKWQSQFKLHPKAENQGKLIIEYQNHEELEKILEQLVED